MQMFWNCISDIVCQALCLIQRLSLLLHTNRNVQHLKCKESKANIYKLFLSLIHTRTTISVSLTFVISFQSINRSIDEFSIHKRYSSHSIGKERKKTKRLRQTLCMFVQGKHERRGNSYTFEHLECVRKSLLRMECARTGKHGAAKPE